MTVLKKPVRRHVTTPAGSKIVAELYVNEGVPMIALREAGKRVRFAIGLGPLFQMLVVRQLDLDRNKRRTKRGSLLKKEA